MWIRVDQSLPAHRKTRELKQKLKLATPVVVGHLVILWLECLAQAVDGELEGWSAEDVEHHAQWAGKHNALCNALCDTLFLDRTPDGFRIHDWWEYAGSLRAAKRQRKYRETKRASGGTNNPSTSEEPVTSRVTSRVTHDGRTDGRDVTDGRDGRDVTDTVSDVTRYATGDVPSDPQLVDGMIPAKEVEQLACDRGWTPWLAGSTRATLTELAPFTQEEWEAAAEKTDESADKPGLPYCLSLIRSGRTRRTRRRQEQDDDHGYHPGSTDFGDGDQAL